MEKKEFPADVLSVSNGSVGMRESKISFKEYLIGLGISALSKNNLGNPINITDTISDTKKFDKELKGK